MRTLIRLALLPVLAFALTACGDSGYGTSDSAESGAAPTTPAPSRGLPEGVAEGVDSPAGVVAGQDGEIHVVTYGSSTNPAVVRQVSAEGQVVTVQVGAAEGKAATMDYVPTTSTFPLPKGVDADQPITFVLGDLGTVTIDSAEPGAQAWVERAEP